MSEINIGERPDFVVSLLNEVDGFDPQLFQPHRKVEEGDKEVGTCSLYMQKMFSLLRYYQREADQAKLDHQYSDHGHDDDVVCTEAFIKYAKAREKYDVLNEIFWACCKQQFNLWGSGSIGVRAGWKVVESKRDDGDGGHLMKLLSMLRGS